MQEKEDNLLPTINEKGDEILVIDNNPENVSRVNDRYADLKDRTADTLKKLDVSIGQLDKNIDTTRKFIKGRDELVTELEVIRDKVEALGPAAKDSEKIKEHLKELEVSVFDYTKSEYRGLIILNSEFEHNYTKYDDEDVFFGSELEITVFLVCLRMAGKLY